MIISHNISAHHVNNQLRQTYTNLSKTMEKLSSGLRINRTADDAAGLAISERMRYQLNGTRQAMRNAQDGISLIQTAEGALGSVHDILQRMRVLALQSSNGTYTSEDRQKLQIEINQLIEEIDNIADHTKFNGIKLLAGNLTGVDKIKITAPYIGVWNFHSIPSHGDRLGVSNSPNAAAFEFTPSPGSSAWIPVEIKDTIHSTLLELKDTFNKVKNNEIMYGTANTIIQNFDMQMHVYGNTVVITSNNHFYMSGTTSSDAEYVSGAPEATYVIADESNQDALTLQIGSEPNQTLQLSIHSIQTQALGIHGLSVLTEADAASTIDLIDSAINTVSSERSRLGSYQNRLEHIINNLQHSNENLTASESRIRDADMAHEMMILTQNQILANAGQAMLAQANALPNTVLQLLH